MFEPLVIQKWKFIQWLAVVPSSLHRLVKGVAPCAVVTPLPRQLTVIPPPVLLHRAVILPSTHMLVTQTWALTSKAAMALLQAGLRKVVPSVQSEAVGLVASLTTNRLTAEMEFKLKSTRVQFSLALAVAPPTRRIVWALLSLPPIHAPASLANIYLELLPRNPIGRRTFRSPLLNRTGVLVPVPLPAPKSESVQLVVLATWPLVSSRPASSGREPVLSVLPMATNPVLLIHLSALNAPPLQTFILFKVKFPGPQTFRHSLSPDLVNLVRMALVSATL